ncbi:hypothetical protein JYU34_006970 [Plutella xylostella]|uniref:Uncharacterized protein n=1 Tax=Plutella xylostella TaxID=51655 RepID=A0ABQ7QTA5_PLUXY|nr:hypothetical protein JYU34_006970 [Plutella xylostella]
MSVGDEQITLEGAYHAACWAALCGARSRTDCCSSRAAPGWGAAHAPPRRAVTGNRHLMTTQRREEAVWAVQ